MFSVTNRYQRTNLSPSDHHGALLMIVLMIGCKSNEYTCALAMPLGAHTVVSFNLSVLNSVEIHFISVLGASYSAKMS